MTLIATINTLIFTVLGLGMIFVARRWSASAHRGLRSPSTRAVAGIATLWILGIFMLALAVWSAILLIAEWLPGALQAVAGHGGETHE